MNAHARGHKRLRAVMSGVDERLPIWKGAGGSAFAAMGTAAPYRASRAERIVHDPLDGAGAASTLSGAAETAIHLAGRAWARGGVFDRGADVVVGEDVAGTDDHGLGIKYCSVSSIALFPVTQSKNADLQLFQSTYCIA